MNLYIMECWNLFKECIKDIALYIMPIAAVVISLLALKKSNDTVQVQVKVSDLEKKLKEYEIELRKYQLKKIKQEENQEKKAKIEARIINISNNKYKVKVWNSGNVTAYNISVSIPEEYHIILESKKMPYEYLEPNDGFDEYVIIHWGSSRKFKIISQWENEHGEVFTNEQLRSC